MKWILTISLFLTGCASSAPYQEPLLTPDQLQFACLHQNPYTMPIEHLRQCEVWFLERGVVSSSPSRPPRYLLMPGGGGSYLATPLP